MNRYLVMIVILFAAGIIGMSLQIKELERKVDQWDTPLKSSCYAKDGVCQ